MKIQEIFNSIQGSKVGNFSGAGVIFFDGTNVLMLKDNTRRWGFPGGKPIQGETPEETARRESIEEIGSCPGEIIDFLRIENDNRTFYSYFSKINSPFKIDLSEEHNSFKWVNMDDLNEMPLKRYVKKNLKTILKKLRLISYIP